MASSALTDLENLLHVDDTRDLDAALLQLEGKLGRVSTLHLAEGIHLVTTALSKVQDTYDIRLSRSDFVNKKAINLLRKSSELLQIASELLNHLMEKRKEVAQMDSCVLLFIADTIKACRGTLRFFLNFSEPIAAKTPTVSLFIMKIIKPHVAVISDSINILLYRVFKSLAFQHPDSQETHTFMDMFDVNSCFGPSAPSFTSVFSGGLKKKIQLEKEDLSYLLGEDYFCALCGEDMAESFAILDACRHTLCSTCAESCFMSKVVHDDQEEPRCPFCRTEVGDWTTSDLIMSEIKNGASPMKIKEDEDLILDSVEASQAMIAYVQNSSEFSPFFLNKVVRHYADRALESAMF